MHASVSFLICHFVKFYAENIRINMMSDDYDMLFSRGRKPIFCGEFYESVPCMLCLYGFGNFCLFVEKNLYKQILVFMFFLTTGSRFEGVRIHTNVLITEFPV